MEGSNVIFLPRTDESGLRFWSSISGREPRTLWNNSVVTKEEEEDDSSMEPDIKKRKWI